MSNPVPVRHTQRVVDATPEVVFEILADPVRHAELDGGGTVQSPSQGAPRRLALGAEFGMKMRMGVPYQTTNRVVEFDEGRRIAWQTGAWVRGRKLFGGQVWRYELTPLDGGRTLVRESYDLSDATAAPVLSATAGRKVQQAMQQTLERLARLVEKR